MCIFHFGLSGNDCTKDEKMAEEVAAFGGRLLVPFWGIKYNHFLESKMKYAHIEYI